MKVLVLTSSFPTRKGGPHTPEFVADLVRQLPARGMTPIVVAPHFPGGRFQEYRDGIHIYRFLYFFPVWFERLAYGAGVVFNIHRDFFAFIGIIPFCLAESLWTLVLLYRERADIIHTHWLIPQGLIGAFFRMVTGIPHVATVHGSDIAVIKKSNVLSWICAFIVRYSDIITVNSSYTRKQLISVVPGSERKIRVIPMGVDPEIFKDDLQVSAKKKVTTGRVILTVGRLIELKGTQYLVEAMPAVVDVHPDVVLVIIGTGPEHERLERRVSELFLDGHVQFKGTVQHDKIAQYYRAADVFVLPSINKSGNTEALGVVLLEAMVYGCPVIGSRVGGIPDIITDGETGFLVPERDSALLADKIIKLLTDTELNEKFKRNGYRKVRESFAWDSISGKFAEVYSQALLEHQNSVAVYHENSH